VRGIADRRGIEVQPSLDAILRVASSMDSGLKRTLLAVVAVAASCAVIAYVLNPIAAVFVLVLLGLPVTAIAVWGLRWSTGLFALAGLVLFAQAAMPVPPMTARRDARLFELKQLASAVNAHYQQHGALPASLDAAPCYQFQPGDDGRSFIIVADYPCSDYRDGKRIPFRYGCNEKLEILKLPPAASEGMNSNAVQGTKP